MNIYELTFLDNTYEVSGTTTEYIISGVSEVGPPGPQGEPGDLGMPDKNFVHSFTNLSSMVIEHGLNKLPAVYVQDSAGDEVVGEIRHLDTNTTQITFTNPFTGKAVFN